MMSFHSVLIVECEFSTNSEFCWGELPMFLDEGEAKAMGIKAMEEWGWDFSNPELHVCPWCNKGIRKDSVITPMIRRVK